MIFQGSTTDDGAGEWEDLEDAVDEVDGAHMDIGWQDDGAKHPESKEYTVAQSAAALEFGTSIRFGRSGGQRIIVPEYAILRRTTDEQEGAWRRREDRAFDRISDGKNPMNELFAVGELAASDVKRTMTTIREPPNSPATIKRKGSSNPTIDTGFTRASVQTRVVVGFLTKTSRKGAS